jgi:hydrogenase maturation protein HypF
MVLKLPFAKIDLPFNIKKPVLAVGADIKNSLCFAHRESAFLSQVTNDLEVLDNFKQFQKRMNSFSRRFGSRPEIIAYDKHPGYFSTKYVLNLPRTQKIKLIPIQHHHAHIASCMAENRLKNQKVIGVAFDGTGFGDDNTLWGAEFLVGDYRSFHRSAHLRNIPLLGGKQAILQPWRASAAWLYLAFGDNLLDLNLDFVKRINKKQWEILKKMWEQNLNAPLASSMGRLFDAVAGIVLNITRVKFEAEAAINLEKAASLYKSRSDSYNFEIKKSDETFVIDPTSTFQDIVTDLERKRSKEEVAARFHTTVAQMIKLVCLKLRKVSRIDTVILTGGVFQNKILFNLSSDLLKKEGFRVITHRLLPCTDVSLSLGQAAVASYAH